VPTTTCRSPSSWPFCWPACTACCAATAGRARKPEAAAATRRLSFHGRTLDLDALELHVGEHRYQLTQMECDLLAYLVRNAGKAVSRKAILEDVWALVEDTDTRAIDNFVVRLRRYLEDDPTRPTLLLTVRGVGYKIGDRG
jgi:DNA-binding response OmpR family regulator